MGDSYYVMPCVVVLFAGGPLAGAREERQVLFGDNHAAIMTYLETHRIPHVHPAPSGPGVEHPRSLSELDRALSLFKGGTPELRLAIAKSLWTYSQPRIVAFWRACEIDDYETRHHLVGLALSAVNEAEKQSLRRWILKDTHPSYATALLRHLYPSVLYEGLSEREQDGFIPLLKRLYAQPGNVARCDPIPRVGSVQEYVIALIPHTRRGRDLLVDWMVSDGKKVAENTVRAMWATWERMSLDPTVVFDRPFVDAAVRRIELAETWLLSSYRPEFCAYPDRTADFQKLVLSQILNPDKTIRRSAVRLSLQKWGLADDLAYLSGHRAGRVLRRRVLSEVEEAYVEHREAMAKVGREDFSSLEARKQALVEALRQVRFK